MIERKRKRAVQLVTDAPQFYGHVYGAWLDTGDHEQAADAVDDDLTQTEARRAVVLTREAAGAPTLPEEAVETLAAAIAAARTEGGATARYVSLIDDGRL